MFFPFSQQAQTNSPNEKKFGQNLSQIGALYDFYGQKNVGRQSSGLELRIDSAQLAGRVKRWISPRVEILTFFEDSPSIR